MQDKDTNHPLQHTQALETLTKSFNDTSEKFPEGTPPQAQTSTNPTQLCELRSKPCNHQQLTLSNKPGLILVPLQNQIKKTSEGEQLTSEGAQPTPEGVHPPKKTTTETWYAQTRKKINIRQTEKKCPRQRSSHLHPIQAYNLPEVAEE